MYGVFCTAYVQCRQRHWNSENGEGELLWNFWQVFLLRTKAVGYYSGCWTVFSVLVFLRLGIYGQDITDRMGTPDRNFYTLFSNVLVMRAYSNVSMAKPKANWQMDARSILPEVPQHTNYNGLYGGASPVPDPTAQLVADFPIIKAGESSIVQRRGTTQERLTTDNTHYKTLILTVLLSLKQ